MLLHVALLYRTYHWLQHVCKQHRQWQSSHLLTCTLNTEHQAWYKNCLCPQTLVCYIKMLSSVSSRLHSPVPKSLAAVSRLLWQRAFTVACSFQHPGQSHCTIAPMHPSSVVALLLAHLSVLGTSSHQFLLLTFFGDCKIPFRFLSLFMPHTL